MAKKRPYRPSRRIELPARSWTADEAFDHCERLTARHYENFPVASILLPRSKRRHIAAVYSFARTADDFADEPGLASAERLALLDEWEYLLDECVEGRARHPVFIALAETIGSFNLPTEPFKRLLKAFRSDVTVNRYRSYEDVLSYCENSANPVGRLVLLLFGYNDEALMSYSDSICTALQLTNFWQDLSIDLQRDRVYLPKEDMRRFGCSEADLLAGAYTSGFRGLMAFQADRTEGLFQAGKPLLREIGNELSLQLRFTWHGGRRILEKIRSTDYSVHVQRPVLTRSDWITIGFRTLVQQ